MIYYALSLGVYADGPGAYLFRGVVEQQYVFHVMDQALCLSESKQDTCTKHEDRMEKKPVNKAYITSLSPLSFLAIIAWFLF